MKRANNLRRRMAVFVPSVASTETKREGGVGLKTKKLKFLTAEEEERKRPIWDMTMKLTHAGFRPFIHEGKKSRTEVVIDSWQYWAICGVLFVISGAMALLWGLEEKAFIVALAFGLILPRYLVSMLTKRRQEKYLLQFTDAIDTIVRGVRSGVPPSECLRIIANDFPQPIQYEFKLIVNEVSAGLTIPDALKRSLVRMPVSELRFFAAVMTVAEKTGGQLADVLGSISSILRQKRQIKAKVKIYAAEASSAAKVLGAMPILIGLAVYFTNRDFMSLLWTTRIGEECFAGIIFLLVTGVVLMNKCGKIE